MAIKYGLIFSKIARRTRTVSASPNATQNNYMFIIILAIRCIHSQHHEFKHTLKFNEWLVDPPLAAITITITIDVSRWAKPLG